MKYPKSAKIIFTLFCAGAVMLSSACSGESNADTNNADENTASSASSTATETDTKTAVTLSDEQKAAIGTRTIEDFYKTVTSKQETSSDDTNFLIKKYMIDKINTENCHFIVRNYGRYETQSQNNVQEIQYSNNNQYYKITQLNAETDYEESFIHKDDHVYWLIFDNRSYVKYQKQYIDITDDEDTYVLTPPSFTEDTLGNPTESGVCRYDGKEMQYEAFGSDVYKTIVYYDNGKPYMIEGYVNDTYDGESDMSDSDFKLISYMSVELDLAIDNSLYEIPSDFRKTTLEELASQISEIQANTSSE